MAYKEQRFPGFDEINIKKNAAFTLPNQEIKKLYSAEFKQKSTLYFGNQPKFEEILERITKYIDSL